MNHILFQFLIELFYIFTGLVYIKSYHQSKIV